MFTTNFYFYLIANTEFGNKTWIVVAFFIENR